MSVPRRGTLAIEWGPTRRFLLLTHIAVGGNWGGSKGVDDAVYSQEMAIDYVRVYEKRP